MPANYLIRLTEGDYTASYTIYYGSVNPSNIATLLGSNLPAEGLTLDEMLSGVSIDIPGTADSIIVFGDGYCANSIEFQVTPTEQPPPPPLLCMTFITDGVLNSWQFLPVSSQNDKTKWEFTLNNIIYTITWNPFVVPNRWEMKFIDNVIFVSANSSNIPDSGWTIEGFTTQYDDIIGLKVIQGQCPTVEPLITEVQADTNLCRDLTRCTGILTVLNTVGGTPPYTYSIDGSTPTTNILFDSVCPGDHILTTIDSIGVETTNNFTIGTGQEPITYTLDVEYFNVTTTNNSTTNVETTEWTITPVPALTAGATLTFDLVIETKQTVNLPGVGFIQDFSSVFFNNTEVTDFSITTSSLTTPRTDGCSTFNKTIETERKIVTLTMRQGDTLSGTGESILYIPIGYGQNVNNCITKLEQDVVLSVSNFTTLSPCSTTETPPATNVLSNSLIPGYNLIDRLCDAPYCKTNCCLYYASVPPPSTPDFIFFNCNGDFGGGFLSNIPTYFCHDDRFGQILIGTDQYTLDIVGCCSDLNKPKVTVEYNLCSSGLKADLYIQVGFSATFEDNIVDSNPYLCGVTRNAETGAGNPLVVNCDIIDKTENVYLEIYDGPILIHSSNTSNLSYLSFVINTSVGREYLVKIYDKL
jgi:hypothetical protein